jgi:3-phosphoshikimate 1-carboxyvinyltransferase
VEDWPDGLAVIGPFELNGAEIRTDGDHRIAMAFAVAGLAAKGKTVIQDAECVAVSYPGFWEDLAQLAPSSVRLA